jgi:hypothetical protein
MDRTGGGTFFFESDLKGRIRDGRPRLRWMADICSDLREMELEIWRQMQIIQNRSLSQRRPRILEAEPRSK